MKILVSTPTYPPAIGGPAQYSKNLAQELEKMGEEVKVRTYGLEGRLPTGLRHFVHCLKIMPAIYWADRIIVLDTYSVAVPVYWVTRIIRRPYIIRTGGDFLWEWYVERTRKKVLLRNFYDESIGDLNFKEKLVFWLIKKVLDGAKKIVFSTRWQFDIWQKPYELDSEKVTIIENYYGERSDSDLVDNKVFVGGVRNLVWKNLGTLRSGFAQAQNQTGEGLVLDLENLPYNDFLEKIKKSYAVILVSLGDISPNMILDAIRLKKPFILTKENGLRDRIGNLGIYVDPLNTEEIKDAILLLATENEYKRQKELLDDFSFTHSWDDIAKEFLSII